jgi:cytoskeletal protein CcmA (bactofilin family)
VVTGVESTIEGVLKCTSACISGKVDGTIKVDGLVDIKKTAVITGELFAKSLQVEEGAVLEATCNIQSSKTKKSNLTKVAKEKQSA